VNKDWVQAFYNMGSYRSFVGLYPGNFVFNWNKVNVAVPERDAQSAVDYFKEWLPKASVAFKGLREGAEQKRQEIYVSDCNKSEKQKSGNCA
jgi:hypothetical protein